MNQVGHSHSPPIILDVYLMYLGHYYLYSFKFYSMLVLVAFCLFACVSDKGDDSGDEVQLTMEGS